MEWITISLKKGIINKNKKNKKGKCFVVCGPQNYVLRKTLYVTFHEIKLPNEILNSSDSQNVQIFWES